MIRKIRKWIGRHKKLSAVIAVAVIWAVFHVAGGGASRSAAAAFSQVTVETRDILTYNSFVGNIQPSTNTDVLSKVSDQVLEVCVENGDTVKAGDVIAILDTENAEYNISLKESSLSATQTNNAYNVKDAQRTYDNYKEALDAGLNSSLQQAQTQKDNALSALQDAEDALEDTEDAINAGKYAGTASEYAAKKQAQEELNSAKATYEDARKAYENAVSASGQDASAEILKAQMDEAQSLVQEKQSVYDKTVKSFKSARNKVLDGLKDAVNNAAKNYDQACVSYDAVKLQVEQQLDTYADNVNKAKASSSTKTSQLELENLKDSLEDYTITAPCDGIITQLNISEGQNVSAGTAVAVISDLQTMEIAIKIDEYSILGTNVGSEVTVYVDATGKTYQGRIDWIASTATVQNGVSYFEATVEFEADADVRGGMSVEIRLTSVDKKGVPAIPVDALQYHEDNTAFVWVEGEDGKIAERDVILGDSDGTYVEVTGGLSEGDSVLSTAVNKTTAMPQPGEMR